MPKHSNALVTICALVLAGLFSATAVAQSPGFNEPVEFLTTPEGLPEEELQSRDLAFSPDGKRMAAGYGLWTTKGVVRVFDLSTRQVLHSIPLTKGVSSIDYSPDGKWLAAASWDNKIHIYDGESVTETTVISSGTKVARAAFSPDGKWLATASEASELKLYDVGTWQEAKAFKGDLFRLQHVAFSPDSKQLCAVGGSFENPRFGRTIVFEIESGKQRFVTNAGNQPLGGVAWSRDGNLIATGGFDGVVRVLDAKTGKERLAMSDPLGGGGNERVAFSPDSQTIAAAGADSMVRFWNAADGAILARIQQPAGVLAVRYSPDGARVACGGNDRAVHVFDARKQQELFVLHSVTQADDTPSPILALAASPDGRLVATSHEDQSVRLRDAASGKTIRSITEHTDVVPALAFSPDSNWLATGSYDRTIKLFKVGVSLKDTQPVSEKPATITLKGHTNWIFAVAFSPDGTKLASSAYDKTVRIWDPAAGKQLESLTGHTATVRTVAWSPNGQHVVSGSGDRTARVWDLQSPGKFVELKGHEAAIRAVAVSPDGAMVATAGEDNSVRLWDPASGKSLRTLNGHTNMVWTLAFSPGGRTLASGSFDNTIRVWDPQTGASRQELKGHTDVVSTLAYTPGSRALLTGSYDKTLKRWATKDPPVPPLADLSFTEAGGARFGFITPDGRTLVAGNNSGYVKFYDMATGAIRQTLKQQRGMAGGEMSRDGKLLITAGYGSQAYLWDIAEAKQLDPIDTGRPDLVAVAISADNSKIAAGGNDGVVVIIDLASKSKLHELPSDGLPLGGVEFSPDGTLLATATGNYKEYQKPGSVKLWDVATGRELASLPGTKAKMRRVRFTADGKTLLACGAQHELLVYDVAKRELKYAIPTDDEMSDIVVLPDQRTLAVGQYKGVVSLWDLQDQRKLGELEGHRSSKDKYVFSVSCSPDGSLVVSAAADSHVKLWSMQPSGSAPPLKPLAEVIDSVTETLAVAWSPDGAIVATGAKDKTLKLRNAKTLEVIRTIAPFNAMVYRLAFHPEGKWLASASNGVVRLWNPADGKELAIFKGHGEVVADVRSLAISPDGRLIAAGNWEGETFIWDANERKLVRNLAKQSLPVTGLAFSPDGTQLASTSGSWKEWQRPGEVKLWNVTNGEELATFDGSTAELRGVCFNRDGTRLIAYGLSKQMFVWDLAKRTRLPSFEPELGIDAVTLLPGDRLVAIGDIRGNVSVRELEGGRVIAAAPGSGKMISTIALAPDGASFATASMDGMVKVWPAGNADVKQSATRSLAAVVRSWPSPNPIEAPTRANSSWQAVLVRELEPHAKQVWMAVHSPDGKLLATGGSDKSIKLWDTATFEQKGELLGHTNFVTHAAWSPDGKRLATSAWDQTVAVWDVEQRKNLAILQGHSMGVRKVAWSPDGKQIASAGEEGKVILWNAETYRSQHVLEMGVAAYSVAYAPDGQWLAVGTGDYKTKVEGKITLIDPASGKRVRDLEGSGGYVFHLHFLDNQRLLAANAGEGVAIWNLTGRTEMSYRTTKDVRWLEASRDGRLIVAAHYDGKSWLSVWERETATPLLTFHGHEDFGFTAAFTPDGKRIVTGAGDGKLKVWELKSITQTAAKEEKK